MRKCLPCTECCRGSIEAHIGDFHLIRHHKCPDVTRDGCSRGDDRPENPCKSFQCGWTTMEWIDEEMRPDKCGALLVCETYPMTDTLVATGDRINDNVKMYFAEMSVKFGRQLIIKEVIDEEMWVTPIGNKVFVDKINQMAASGQRIE